MTKLLIALLVLSQLMILPPTSFRWGKEVAAQILILVFLCSLIFKKNKSFGLFLGWSTFIFILSKSFYIDDTTSSPTYSLNLMSFLTMINIVFYGLMYYILHEMKFDIKQVMKTICLIAVAQTAYIFLQKLQLDQFFIHLSSWVNESGARTRRNWPVGFWGNEALASWCIALCSPFFLAFKKLRYKIGYVASFIAVLFTECSAGILAFVMGFIFWLFFKKRWVAIGLLVLALAGGIFAYTQEEYKGYFNPTHRFGVWKKSIEIASERPITGQGHGSYRATFWKLAPEFRLDGHWAQAHNEYIQVFYEQGIVGLGILLSMMWIIFYKFWKKRKGLVPVTSLFILAILSFFGFPMRTAMMVIPLIALVIYEKSCN